jgi:hypothetical protein
MAGHDYQLEHDDLVERYSTPREQLTPEMRRLVEATEAWEADLVAIGQLAAPHPLLDDNTSPGLDETNGYRPFWTDRPSD